MSNLEEQDLPAANLEGDELRTVEKGDITYCRGEVAGGDIVDLDEVLVPHREVLERYRERW